MNKTKSILIGLLQGDAVQVEPDNELESKKEIKTEAKKQFKQLLKDGANPLLCFQVVYHRMSQIANVAKEVFYDPAVQYIKDNPEQSQFFGHNVTLKVSEDYEVLESPKIKTLEKEKQQLEKKHSSAIKAYEAYQTDVKSLNNQIKEERNRLIEKGMAKKKGESYTIALKY